MSETCVLSESKVLHSAAGYYIGREYNEGYGWMPYSRESVEYYQTHEEAEKALREKSYTVRGWV
jgi:hypothetical protein